MELEPGSLDWVLPDILLQVVDNMVVRLEVGHKVEGNPQLDSGVDIVERKAFRSEVDIVEVGGKPRLDSGVDTVGCNLFQNLGDTGMDLDMVEAEWKRLIRDYLN